ncbi:MAG: endonuclease/exonuclease/phosphatase family protein [Ginsengibacter sp.]
MVTRSLKFLKGFLIFINLSLIACCLMVYSLPYINSGRYWYFALPGLIFPLIFFGLVLFILIWAFAKSKWFWVSFIVLLLGIQQILAVFGFHFPEGFNGTKSENTLRVLQWNVTNWDQNNEEKKGKESSQLLMLGLVKEQNADVLCFQEFFEPLHTKYFQKNIRQIVKLGYPYYYFVSSVTFKHDFKTGVAIFSKYPIIDSAKFDFGEDSFAEHLIYTDIKIKDKIVRVITIHLQSVRFGPDDYQSINELKNRDEAGLKDSRTIVAKLKKGYTYRYSQAEIVRKQIEASPYPVILCGDFNDVPNSNTYFTVKGKLQDAFLKKGFFIGRTFRFISPTLRIDYIFADKKFTIEQYQRIRVPYSDHYPVEADLAY